MGCGGSTIVEPEKGPQHAGERAKDVTHANLVVLENQRLDFDQLMADDVGLQYIAEFAAGEYSDENLLFLKEAVRFK